DDFFWWKHPVAEQFSDPGSRNVDPIFFVVWTCLLRCLGVTSCTIEHFVEESHIDPDLIRPVLVEHGVAGVFVVIATDTCVVASDEGVGTAIIFHNNCM